MVTIEQDPSHDARRMPSALRLSVSRKIEDARNQPVKKDTSLVQRESIWKPVASIWLKVVTTKRFPSFPLAVSLDPKLTEAHNLLGVAYDKKGFGDRAKDSFERAVKIEEDADTLNNLGFSLYQNGNYRAAVDRLKRAAKLAPH